MQKSLIEERNGETAGVMFVVGEYNEFLWEYFQSIPRGGTDQDAVPETTEFASGVHSFNLGSKKKMNCYWWDVFGPKHSWSVLVHDARCQGIPRVFLVHVELKRIFDSVIEIL